MTRGDAMNDAHKIGAGAMGRLSIAIVKRDGRAETLHDIAVDMRRALALIEKISKPKQPWER